MKVSIRPTERLALFGRTGSGKTTLARHLLQIASPRWVILDPKHDFRPFDGAKLNAEYRKRDERQIIRVEPDRYELERWDDVIEGVWREATRSRPIILYSDETTLINPSTRLRPALGKAIRTGRSRGMGTWIGSQRPKDIPSACFTEMEHFAVFSLQWDEDRKKVGSFTSRAVYDALERLRGHDFVYYNVLQGKGAFADASWTAKKEAG